MLVKWATGVNEQINSAADMGATFVVTDLGMLNFEKDDKFGIINCHSRYRRLSLRKLSTPLVINFVFHCNDFLHIWFPQTIDFFSDIWLIWMLCAEYKYPLKHVIFMISTALISSSKPYLLALNNIQIKYRYEKQRNWKGHVQQKPWRGHKTSKDSHARSGIIW